MTIYWSFKQVPELASLSAKVREAKMQRVSSLALKHWEWWVALLGACVLTGLGAYFGGSGISGMVGAGLGGGLGGLLHIQAVIFVARKYHAHELAATGDA